jgi:hypothetical protein
MARKLLCLVALISLVLLVQAVPGLADTYTLPGGGWIESHGIDSNRNITVGSANSSFNGQSSLEDEVSWIIGENYLKYLVPGDPPVPSVYSLMNSDQATSTVVDQDANIVTFTTVYNTIESPGTVKFSVNIPDGPSFSSLDAVITITGTYQFYSADAWHFREGTLTGTGTNSDNGVPFTLSADLIEVSGDHNHSGYFDNFQMVYDPAATPTPIPGAVWLLGTGLLGLACVGRRRRS